MRPAASGGANDMGLASMTGAGAAPRNSGRRIAGRDACPPEREESPLPDPFTFLHHSTDRVGRDDFSGTLHIVTIGTAELDDPLSVAPPNHNRDTTFS